MERDNQDFIDLNQLGRKLQEHHNVLADKSAELAAAQCKVLTLKMEVSVLSDAKKDHEELIRIKKMEINHKP